MRATVDQDPLSDQPHCIGKIRSGEEGKQETTWVIPVRGGPSYEAVRVWSLCQQVLHM